MSQPYTIQYAEAAVADLAGMRAFDRRRVLDGIVTHPSHEPKRTSKSRIKQMTQPFWRQYRLRADDFRVYYDVDDNSRTVSVLRVLEKETSHTPEHSP